MYNVDSERLLSVSSELYMGSNPDFVLYFNNFLCFCKTDHFTASKYTYIYAVFVKLTRILIGSFPFFQVGNLCWSRRCQYTVSCRDQLNNGVSYSIIYHPKIRTVCVCILFQIRAIIQYRHFIPEPVARTSASAWLYIHRWITCQIHKASTSMAHVACRSKLRSVVKSSMHPCRHCTTVQNPSLSNVLLFHYLEARKGRKRISMLFNSFKASYKWCSPTQSYLQKG